jgi:diguanylate cyclase (GGDEF)-like protein
MIRILTVAKLKKNQVRRWLGLAASCVVVEHAGYLLAHFRTQFNPRVWAGSQIITASLAFALAATILLRFYGTGDRFSLLLGLGMGLVGLIQVGGIIELLWHFSTTAAQLRVALSWMASGTLFALLLLAAPYLGKHLPWPRDPQKTIGAALALVSVCAALVVMILQGASREPAIYAARFLPRPWNLLPAAIFLAATAVLSRPSHLQRSDFGGALVWTAGANSAAYLVASQSIRLLDVPAVAAQGIIVGSYALLLGATLLDSTRLFGEIRQRATSDSLTGLANYERFLDVLQSELQRSSRTGRPFSLMLMDLDGLKQINDVYGHLIGSESLCRVARILQQECRSLDTAARYGGDEFGLILPETGETTARDVAARIRSCVQSDPGKPRLSLSIGTATHPRNGLTIDLLLDAADQKLYAAKARSNAPKSLSPEREPQE